MCQKILCSHSEEEYYNLLREYALEYEVNDEAGQNYLESLNEQLDFIKKYPLVE